MKKNISLRHYFIRLFLITLFFVGISELFVNILYLHFLSPLLNRIFFLDKLLETQTLFSILSKSAVGLFWHLLSRTASFLPQIVSEPIRQYIQARTNESIFVRFLHIHGSMSAFESKVYALSLISILILLVFLWTLPFIAASIVFSILVSKKVKGINDEALSRQKEYERHKYLLLSDMAHDLKTPITTISGYADALLENELSEADRERYLQAIRQKSLQMDHVITLLFEYVRLDSSGFSLHLTTENYSELIRGCIAALYTDFEKKLFELDLHFPETDIYAHIDKMHMERAISNILQNAIKHNPEHTKVTISLSEENKQIMLSVYDSGVPIPADIITSIFEPFVQGDFSRTSQSGTGLGLSISKKVVEMHQGTLALLQPASAAYTKAFILTIPTYQ